jgi:hopanoid biosynthesis associated radical SAM protein HpnH
MKVILAQPRGHCAGAAPASSGAPALPIGADARTAVSQQPRVRGLRQDRLPRKDPEPAALARRLEAIDECGAPVVVLAGGEPLLHKELPEIVAGALAKGKFVTVCTNALLMDKRLAQYQPHNRFNWSVHLDGDKEMHDRSVCQQGVYEKAVAAITNAKSKGFRVNINCTLFTDAEPQRVARFFDDVRALGVDGITVSPGYAYERAPDQ